MLGNGGGTIVNQSVKISMIKRWCTKQCVNAVVTMNQETGLAIKETTPPNNVASAICHEKWQVVSAYSKKR